MSHPQFQQRWQIYKVDSTIDGRLASIAPGGLVAGIEFQTDPDAPFLMRGRCYRVQYDTLASRTQVGLQNVAMRVSGKDQDFRSNQLVPQNLVMAYGGQSAAWKSVYPQVWYPARSTMTIDVLNNSTTATLTQLELYFLGVKLFPWGVNPPYGSSEYTYPKRMRATQYGYGINYLSPPDPTNPTASIVNLLTADSRQAQTFQAKNDADFVIREIQAGPSYAPFALQVYLTLRDENQKAYSNLPVHFEVLAGPSGGNYQTGSAGSITAIGTGNSMKGIIFPELYIPKNHKLYYDIVRQDSGYAGAQTIPNFPVTLLGSRVYEA
jgi:hypothetical protein